MRTEHPLSGVYAAALSPLTKESAPNTEALTGYLAYLADNGCHGALLLGTTGEGPSFATDERRQFWQAAARWRETERPDFRLLAGTGSPALSETITYNQMAFALGYEAVVVLPPYYFRNASEDGLFDWYSLVIEESVPEGRYLLGYHIPQVSGVALPPSLLARLASAYPTHFAGLKDSSGDLAQARAYVEALPNCAVLVGNDQLLADTLDYGAAGCITAGATLWPALLRQVYDGEASVQSQIDPLRHVLDNHPPAPAFLKALLRKQHSIDLGPVRAPLLDFTPEQTQSALAAWSTAES